MNFFSKIKENPLLSLLIILLILLGIVFVVVLYFEDPKQIFNLLGVSKKEQPKYEALKFLGISMGGILVALQALMSYKRAKAMEETAKAQADAVLKTEDGLRQERLKNAIEHLGHEKDSVRLGGAYELFHLAKDAKEDTEELRQTVLDILCAHIRWTTGESEYQKAHASKPSEEVQSLLRLMFVQKHEVFKGCGINLQGSWLNGADLVTARLEKAVLTRVHLQRAELFQARLQGAELFQARLQGAEFFWARLQGASLDEAHLEEAILQGAYLQGAVLFQTYLQGAFLEGAYLQGAVLRQTYLQGANLDRVQLQGASLTEVGLQSVSLEEANLNGAISVAWAPTFPFSDRIHMQIGQETNLLMQNDQGIISVGAIFSGGLSQEDVDTLVEGLSGKKAKELREKLEPHVDQPESNELPPMRYGHIFTGAYTEEEAEQWIAGYEKDTSEVSKNNS